MEDSDAVVGPTGGDPKKALSSDDPPQEQNQQRPQQQQYQEHPTAFQGGWQGLKLDPNNNNDQDGNNIEENEQLEQSPQQEIPPAGFRGFLARWEQAFPRTYHVTNFLILPLLGLIVLSFVCGYFVARLESAAEKEANRETMAGTFLKLAKIDLLARAATQSPTFCLDNYVPSSGGGNDSAIFNRTELAEHMERCGQTLATTVNDIVHEFQDEYKSDIYSDLRFDWTICRPNNTAPRNRAYQAEFYANVWIENLHEIEGVFNNTETTGAEYLSQVPATDQCRVNGGAGALFWFTVMTTIVSTVVIDRQSDCWIEAIVIL